MAVKRKMILLYVPIVLFVTTSIFAGLLDFPEKVWNFIGDHREGELARVKLPEMEKTIKEKDEKINHLKDEKNKTKEENDKDRESLEYKATRNFCVGLTVGVLVTGAAFAICVNQQEKERLEKRVSFSKLKKSLNACLFRCRDGLKDGEGMPIDCKDLIEAYIGARGREKYETIKSAFLVR